MSEAKIIEFQKIYPTINLKLMKDKPEDYDKAILAAHIAEVENGFIVKKQNKTTAKGTKFTYEACNSIDRLEKYKAILIQLIKKI